MKMYKKVIAGLLMMVTFLPIAQSQDVEKAKSILMNLSHNYDTSTNLSFSVSLVNIDEPVGGKLVSDKAEGKYALKANNAFYTMKDIEVMQNDSFIVAVYPKDKFVIVSKPKNNGNAKFFPFRETMDSLLKLSATKYAITSTIDKKEKIGTLTFAAKDSNEKVKEFRLIYNTVGGLISSIRYLFDEYKQAEETNDNAEKPAMVLHKKTMLIEFADYSHEPIPASVLSEKKYIFFDGGECKLAEKYSAYKLYYSPPATVKN
jgi:hypothetical protein